MAAKISTALYSYDIGRQRILKFLKQVLRKVTEGDPNVGSLQTFPSALHYIIQKLKIAYITWDVVFSIQSEACSVLAH